MTKPAPHLDEDQEAARRFLREILRLTGMSPTVLAREAGLSHTTITRLLNGRSVKHTLSERTVAKIRRAALARGLSADLVNQVWLIAQSSPGTSGRGLGNTTLSASPPA